VYACMCVYVSVCGRYVFVYSCLCLGVRFGIDV